MGKIIFILGGVRSGKSNFALKISQKQKNVLFVATAQPSDLEMIERIKKHKQQRPKNWETLEIKNTFLKIHEKKFDIAIIDCLTIFVSNCILSGDTEQNITKKVTDFLTSTKKWNNTLIIVSNEVGMGIVPKNKLARKFRDILGSVNQTVSTFADKVYFMISGVPTIIK
ncbi:MAG: bifunctional adenosylcobinamide kinase/adenosylcobinamide-phosphate guanylyltransferase [Elusimicrobiota bacterium]